YVGEQRRLVEPPAVEMRRSSTADDHLGALFDAERDICFDTVPLAFCREWTEYGFGIRGVAHDDASHDLGYCGDDFVVTMPGNEYPRERRAHLPRVVDARGHEAREKSLEVDVVSDNAGRFAAELESDAGDALGAEAHDSPAGSRASGERDLVDVVVADEMFADFTACGNDADHAFGELRGFEGFGEHHGAHGSLRCGLEHNGASGRKRCR